MRKRIVGPLSACAWCSWCSPGVVALVVTLAAGGAGCAEQAPPPLVPSPMPVAPPALPTPPTPIEDPPHPALAPRPIMGDAQKKFLVELELALAARDPKKVAALYSTGAVLSSAGKEGVHEAMGRAEIEKGRERGFAVMGKAFPDIKWVHTRALQSGDMMVLEWVATGTDTGGFLEDKPTHKKVGWRGISLLQFDDDGLVKRETTVLDPMTIMGQLGRGESRAKVRAPAETSTLPTQWLTAKASPEEQKNLATARNLYPLIEKKDDKAFAAMLTDDVVHSNLAQPEDVKGRDGAKRELGIWSKALPDRKLNVKTAWAFGDIVVVEVETTGTFTGPLGALKPNGKAATTHAVDVLEMKGGKISRLTSYANAREFLVQYGLMTPPPPN